MNLHATCIAINRLGVLLRGPSGSGKSDLALRLIDQSTDAILVADDRVDVNARDGGLYACAPGAIAGLLEVRGLGVMRVPHAADAKLALIVDLTDAANILRLPDALFEEMLGVQLPRIRLAPFEASAPAKLRQALRNVVMPETGHR